MANKIVSCRRASSSSGIATELYHHRTTSSWRASSDREDELLRNRDRSEGRRVSVRLAAGSNRRAGRGRMNGGRRSPGHPPEHLKVVTDGACSVGRSWWWSAWRGNLPPCEDATGICSRSRRTRQPVNMHDTIGLQAIRPIAICSTKPGWPSTGPPHPLAGRKAPDASHSAS